jgi:FkbM family methyltransferase
MNPYWKTEEIRQFLGIKDGIPCKDLSSYSQLAQDADVIKYYGYKTGGYFVDVGAHDGISFSNTYLLDNKYNWKGICVEPVPDNYNLLVKHRPNTICVQKAVFSTGGVELDFSVDDMLSGITNMIDHHHVNGRSIKVMTTRLDELLTLHNAPSFIEYLSVDTEGSELEVLKSIDFTKYKFGVIHLEHNWVEPRRTQMREFLVSKGYKYQRENNWDDEYIFPL